MQGVANARPQFPTDSLRRSKWPRNCSHSSPVGVRYSSVGRSARRRAMNAWWWVRHQFAGRRQPVLDQAVVGEFEKLFAAEACGAEHFDDRRRPEGVVFFPCQVVLAAVAVVCPGPDAGLAGRGPSEGLPAGVERRAGRDTQCGVQCSGRAVAVPGSGTGQDGEAFAGAAVHPGLAPPVFLAGFDVGLGDRAGDGPLSPPGRVLRSPSRPGPGRRRGLTSGCGGWPVAARQAVRCRRAGCASAASRRRRPLAAGLGS